MTRNLDLAAIANAANARADDVANLGPAPVKPAAPPSWWDAAAAVGSLVAQTVVAIRDQITEDEIRTVAGWIVRGVVGAATSAAIERATGER